nr:unnamed protein product [Leishmania braziliensis]
MAQQQSNRRYEGYGHPTEFPSAPTGGRDNGAGAYFGGPRPPSSSTTSLSSATGLVRRSAQHTGATATANATGYQSSYGYFHGQGNSIDVNSDYNSDAGSSTSNPLYGGGGSGGSITNSTAGRGSPRPLAQQTFLPSEALVQSLPPSSWPQRRHTYQQPQPYAVPVPCSTASNLQQGTASGAVLPEAAFVQRSGPYMASPVNMSGPRMPVAYDASGSPSITGAGMSGVSGARGASGFLGRLMAQVLPVLDDSAGGPGTRIGAGSAASIVERPPYQVRFGNPDDDLPLLEELGIFPRRILDKARAVLNPFKPIGVDVAKDTDLAGPIFFAFSLAVLLSLRGKIQFSAIYGLFVLGVGFFKMLLSLMQPRGDVPLQFVASMIGYGLLPTVLLAGVCTVGSWLMGLRGVLPLTLLMVTWSAWCGTTLVVKGLGMEEQRYLVLYPMLLFYSAFNVVAVY